jgi:hypothetical protein
MKLTYKGESKVPDKVKLKLLLLTVTLDGKGMSMGALIFLMLFVGLFNAVTWPFVFIWIGQHLGLPWGYDFKTWIGLAVSMLVIHNFLDKE